MHECYKPILWPLANLFFFPSDLYRRRALGIGNVDWLCLTANQKGGNWDNRRPYVVPFKLYLEPAAQDGGPLGPQLLPEIEVRLIDGAEMNIEMIAAEERPMGHFPMNKPGVALSFSLELDPVPSPDNP